MAEESRRGLTEVESKAFGSEREFQGVTSLGLQEWEFFAFFMLQAFPLISSHLRWTLEKLEDLKVSLADISLVNVRALL